MNTCTHSFDTSLWRIPACVLYSIPKWLRSLFLRVPLFAVLLAGIANGNDKDFAFSYVVGAPPPYPSDTVRIVSFPISSGVSLAASVKSQTGGNWLSVDPTSGSTPQVFTIRTDPARLGPGTYVGAVEIRGGGLNDFTVGVTLVVRLPVAPKITTQPASSWTGAGVAGTGPSNLWGAGKDLFSTVNQSFTGFDLTIFDSNLNATKESGEPNHAGNIGGKSLWWSWTAQGSGTVTVDTILSGFDTLLAVYTGSSVSELTEIASDDNSGGNGTSRLTFNTPAGNVRSTYQIAVDGVDGASGAIHLHIVQAGAVNQTVAVGTGVSFSVGFSGDPPLNCQWQKDGAAIPGATSSSYTISSAQTSDAGSYTVVVTNRAGSVTGNAATLTVLAPPGNDLFSSRIPLAGVNVTASGSNVAATTESGELLSLGTRSVWYTWTAPTGGPVTVSVDTIGSSFDTMLAVYTGSTVSALNAGLVTYDNDSGSNRTSRLTFNANAGTTYQIAVTGWGGATGAITLHLATSPVLVSQPRSVLGRVGSTVALTVAADGATPLNYQWRKNGVNIPGATNSTLVINAVAAADVGSYSVLVTNTLGSTVSGAATITLANLASTAAPPRLANISVRSIAGTGNQTLILGFALGGAGTTGSNRVLIRGIGPSLAPFGVTGVLSDPTITLFNGSTPMVANDNWGGDPQLVSIGTAVGAFAFSSPISKDAALYRPAMASASYTVQLGSSVSGAVSGVALAEIYDATPAASFTASTPRLVNISARSQVGTGSDILIAGFVIDGPAAQTVLVRGLGPALAGFGLTGVLADPKLELFQSAAKIGENDDWGGASALSTVFSRIGAFALNNPASKDAALMITLPPGTYTAQVRGVGDTTGVALVEVYEVP